MALSKAEFRRRVVAAAALHGLGMRQLRDHLEAFGADRTLAETLIKDENARLPKQLRDLSEALEVPTAWFEVEDWRSLIYAEGSPTLPQIQAERDVARLALTDLRYELEALRKSPPPGEQPEAGSGS